MTKILIICSAGMSSSLIAKKAQILLNQKGHDVIIEARNIIEGDELIRKNSYDLYMVSPQAKIYMDGFKNQAARSNAEIVEIPVECYVPIPSGFEKMSRMIEGYIKN